MTYLTEDRLLLNPTNYTALCNTNEGLIPPGTKVTGLILEFPGLGGGSCLGGNPAMEEVYDNAFTRRCAETGLVTAYLFPGPWSWMNHGAVRIIDLTVDAIYEKYGLTEEAPLVVMGGSMGGLGALIYATDSRHAVTACAAHCPCHNVPECYDVLPDFPRTFLAAVNCYDMPLEKALEQISPEHRIGEMRDIPYFITADELDTLFPPQGVERMVKKMRTQGLSAEYLLLPGQTHGGISPEDRERMNEFILSYCQKIPTATEA